MAGETSGDLHGGALVRELKRLDGSLKFFGIGGDSMELAGVELLEHADNMAVVGFTEVVGKYPFLRSVFNRIVRECARRNPVRAVLIDYPGFNLTLARRLARDDIPITYYIPPQVWAWREKRVQTLKEAVDQILCIFPFEPDWYESRGVTVNFVGHPILDHPEDPIDLEAFQRKHGVDPKMTTVGLMPGSRQEEVNRHLPVMVEAVEILKEKGHDLKGIIGRARGVKMDEVENPLLSMEDESPRAVLRFGTVGLVASGTATLEAALFGTPCVVIYRMSAASWRIGRRLASVDSVALPNLIAGDQVFPEFLQGEVTGKRAAEALQGWIESPQDREAVVFRLQKVRDLLGGPGASRRAAGLIVERLEKAPEGL